jgi:hypothetical protein
MLEEKQSQRPFRTVFRLHSPHTLSKATKSSNATSIIAIFIGQNPAAVKVRCCIGVMIFYAATAICAASRLIRIPSSLAISPTRLPDRKNCRMLALKVAVSSEFSLRPTTASVIDKNSR